MKLDQAKKDIYRRKAKKEGYRSRATFKLLQIDKKYRIFKRGDIVLDFGCAPGGWLQYISKIIGSKGFALGIDVKPMKPIAENVSTLVADVNDLDIGEKIVKKLPKKTNVVTSDISQSLSGIWELDVARQNYLTLRVIQLFPLIHKRGGSAVLKIFQGDQFNLLLDKVNQNYRSVMIIKPPASRPQSSEVYLLCREYIL